MIGGFPPPVGTKEERELLSLFKKLDKADKLTLLKFAGFLSQSDQSSESTDAADSAPKETPQPELIERPKEESVIKAIKRLTRTYPMVDKETLLHQTSDLMTDHLIKGRDAQSVIDDLEAMFREAYEKLLDK